MYEIKQNRVSLKNVKFYEGMSEETNAFTADIYFDGKKIGFAKNDGHGGCTDYNRHEGKLDKLKECMAYCETLPDIDYGSFQMKCNLEHVIDYLFEAWLDAKIAKQNEKKRVKLMSKAILLGIPNESNYSYVDLKQPLTKIPTPLLQNTVNKIKQLHCKGGKVILNTNLTELGISF